MTQISLVQDFSTVIEPDLSLQEEIDITFAPDNNDTFLQDKYDEDIELIVYTLIPKDTVFDPTEDIENTEILKYTWLILYPKNLVLII
jgi:hypothetical protein